VKQGYNNREMTDEIIEQPAKMLDERCYEKRLYRRISKGRLRIFKVRRRTGINEKDRLDAGLCYLNMCARILVTATKTGPI